MSANCYERFTHLSDVKKHIEKEHEHEYMKTINYLKMERNKADIVSFKRLYMDDV